MPEQTPLSAAAATRKFALLRPPARHAGKCTVCRNRNRLGIKLRLMACRKPAHIACENGIKSRASIGSWMSLIPKGGKSPNPGRNAFHIAPETFPATIETRKDVYKRQRKHRCRALALTWH